jgi:uncharacterized membrane protein
VFFSDAVFAIAMTVLVLTLAVPANTTNADVAHALRSSLPSVFSYVLSFAVIATYWLVHHRMFRYIQRIDTTLLVLNLSVLGLVAFVPYPSSVLGRYGETTAAVVFYASTIGILGSLIVALWSYASHRRRLIPRDTPPQFIRHAFWRSATTPIVFFASIPIAFVDPTAAKWFWLTIVIVHALLRRRYGNIETRRAPTAGADT